MSKKELYEIIDKLVNKDIRIIKDYAVEINEGKPFFTKNDYKTLKVFRNTLS